MAVSEFEELRKKIRKAVRDASGLLFSDTALDNIINEAQREYSMLAGSLVSSFPVTSAETDALSAPVDFVEFVRFVGSDGFEKPFFSWKYLHRQYPDFRVIPGTEVSGIIADFDGFGKFRLFPKITADTFAGTMYYRRTAKKNVIETTNDDAVTQYALFTAFLLNGKSAAGTYYQRFSDAVNAESKMERALKTKSTLRRGRFF